MQQDHVNQAEDSVQDVQKGTDNYCASDWYAFVFQLSSGNNHDAPEGRKLIEIIYSDDKHYLFMDRAYEDDKTRALDLEHGYIRRKTVKFPGSITRNYINAATRLNAIFLH